MAGPAAAHPKKIKPDAVTEALFEIRYEVPGVIPDATYIQLIAAPEWKDFEKSRLPAYEIPPTLRVADPNLKYQPTFQLTQQGEEPCSVRVGPNVISLHRLKTYIGWDRFRPQLEQMVDRLFATNSEVTASRLGLRYLNAFTIAKHGISTINDLNLNVSVAGAELKDFVNLNYLMKVDGVGTCTVRIATPNFVNGSLPEDTTVFADVDVASAMDTTFKASGEVKDWLRRAHDDVEKDAFFHLLTEATKAKLKAD